METALSLVCGGIQLRGGNSSCEQCCIVLNALCFRKLLKIELLYFAFVEVKSAAASTLVSPVNHKLCKKYSSVVADLRVQNHKGVFGTMCISTTINLFVSVKQAQ